MSNLKKVLALVLVMALSLTMFAGAIETVLPFDDTDKLTSEQYSALELLYAIGVIKGDDKNSVNAEGTLTRAELCAILYRLYTGDAEEKNVSTYDTKTVFSDCDSSAWYNPYVNWAYIKGVVLGYGDGKFGPLDPVTGVQAAVMLARLVGYEIGSEGWVLKGTQLSMELGFDKGVRSKDLYGSNLARGDMFVMIANAIKVEEVGKKTTILDRVFDVEIIYSAVLAGVDKLGGTKYSLFMFKDQIAGDVKWYFYGLLSIESNATVDEIGQKYTLYVSKKTDANGYRRIYAAYEESENDYYKVVTGTVDDKKLVTDESKKDFNVKYYKATNAWDKKTTFYINGATADSKGNPYTFADFAASYNVLNSGTYKLIDTDGDGVYEFIFIERLTLATMKLETVVASVTGYNATTKSYTLSNGNSYPCGQYWGVKDDKIIETNTPVKAVEQIEKLIGTTFTTASNVLYKFTIENGKYLMKVEICDETYFAGSYVLTLDTVGTSTYKGYRYVEFLTEDNVKITAYIRNINHMDSARIANFVDNEYDEFGWLYTDIVCDNLLLYVDKLDGDFIDVFTAAYWNSNYANAVNRPTSPYSVTSDKTIYTAVPAVDDVYGMIWNKNTDGKIAPSESYNASSDYFYMWKDATGAWYANYLDMSYSTKAPVYTDNKATMDKLASNFGYDYVYGDDSAAGEINTIADLITAIESEFGVSFTQKYKPQFVWMYNATIYSGEFVKLENTTNPTYAIAKLTYTKQAKLDLSVTIEFNFNASDFQLYKTQGTWYAQYYVNNNNFTAANATIYFTINGEKTAVKYDATIKNFVLASDNTKIYGVGTANPETINTGIGGVIAGYASSWDTYFTKAIPLNTSKGVVFAYGSYPASAGSYYGKEVWRAYNFDEFNVKSFGEGGPGDDNWDLDRRNPLTKDQMIYTIDANGTYYVKAMKVTVSENDELPFGWMVKNSVIFIYADQGQSGWIDGTGRTIRAYAPNGTYEEFFINYGYNFRRGDVVYAVLAEDNKTILSLEVICNDIRKGIDLQTGGNIGNYIKLWNTDKNLNGDEKYNGDFYKYEKGGKCTAKGIWGTDYSKTLDPDKTYFVDLDGKHLTEADFIKALNDMTGTKAFYVLTFGDRYVACLGAYDSYPD